MSLYHKYRPATLKEVRGNRVMLEALESKITSDDIPQAIMFIGGSGTGKTTLARICGSMLEIKSEFDLIEMDAADDRSVKTVREIKRSCRAKSMTGGWRMWIVDECHMLTPQAQEAFLKLLEDPPSHAIFILCTTEPDKMIKTIHTRCSTFETSPLTDNQMDKLLKDVIKKEKRKVPEEATKAIVHNSQGSARLALTTLDTIIDMPKDRMVKIASRTIGDEKESIDLCRILLKKNTTWNEVAAILKGLRYSGDPESIRRHVLKYATTVILSEGSGQAAAIIYHFEDNVFDSGFAGVCKCCWEVINS